MMPNYPFRQDMVPNESISYSSSLLSSELAKKWLTTGYASSQRQDMVLVTEIIDESGFF
jgi:hypothetical protein